jgi:drug/metabolite transporter (DMT)-like permease
MKKLLNTRGASLPMVAAFFVIYFVWGSTYLAGRVAVGTLPPFFVAALRSLAAGLLLWAWTAATTGIRPVPWRSALVPGALLFTGGHGLLMYAMRTVPSGPAAVISALVPIWILLLIWLTEAGPAPSARECTGTAVGIVGVSLLAAPWRTGAGELDPFGVTLLMGSALSWAAGTVMVRRRGTHHAVRQAVAMQLIAGGALALAVSLALGETGTMAAAAFTLPAVGALAYLVVGGSLLGVLSYSWLLNRATPAKVTSYAYVNPVVAMVLGWALAGEQVSARMLAAAAVTVVGIALVLIPGAPVAAVAAGTLYGANRPDAVGRPARAAQSERRAMIGSTRVARRAGR